MGVGVLLVPKGFSFMEVTEWQHREVYAMERRFLLFPFSERRAHAMPATWEEAGLGQEVSRNKGKA